MIIIYTKEKEPKEIFNTILTKAEVEKGGGLFIDHPELREEDCIVAEVEKPFKNPISDDLEGVREMTREELILLKNKTELLQDGEIVEDGEIKKVEVPANLIRASWNKEKQIWVETITKEELQDTKTDLILEHNKKRKEIATLNEESEYFDVSESVAKANSELEEIRAKINGIDKVINGMNEQQ